VVVVILDASLADRLFAGVASRHAPAPRLIDRSLHMHRIDSCDLEALLGWIMDVVKCN
jgi:hypothetical protein